ncbi:hypothetical protein GFM07_11905 [Rhizobium leguminosarum bv. viciae]|nr:hypothetical protein [Rhizobium leguminosarum bv. viciae]
MTSTREHDAEKRARFSDHIMLYSLIRTDSVFRPIRPKINLFQGAARHQTREGRCITLNCRMVYPEIESDLRNYAVGSDFLFSLRAGSSNPCQAILQFLGLTRFA